MRSVILCLVFSLTLAIQGAVHLERTHNQQGYPLVRILNTEPRAVYCYISGVNYYVDFYVYPNQVSRWYYEPQGYYEWRCQ